MREIACQERDCMSRERRKEGEWGHGEAVPVGSRVADGLLWTPD